MSKAEGCSGDYFLFFKKVLYLAPFWLLFVIITPLVNYQYVKKQEICFKRLLQGFPVIDYGCDQRLLNSRLIGSFQKGKQVVVFGSSRSWQIALIPYLKKYTSFFNHGVACGELKDFMHVYNLYKQRDMVPAVILLECSPWWLNKNYNKNYSIWPLSGISYQFFKIYNLFSPMPLRIMFEKILTLMSDRTDKAYYKVYPDGHRDWLTIKKGVFCNDIFKQNAFRGGLDNFYEINEEAWSTFITFVNMMLSDGVRVILFLPPYHPITYEKIKTNTKYQKVFEVQSFFIEAAKKYNIEVAGSYDPTKCGCDASDFFDYHHTYRSSTKKIFKNILDTL